MPSARRMSWEGKPYYRWVKMYKGQRFRVSCEELGAMVYTEDASRSLANAWWDRKQETIDGPTRIEKIVRQVETVPVSTLKDMVERGQAARQLLQSMPFTGAVDAALVSEVVGFNVYDVEVAASMMSEVVGKVSPPLATQTEKTLKANARNFLAVLSGQSKPLTFREIRQYVNSLVADLGEGFDVCGFDEKKVEAVFLDLKRSGLSDGVKKKRWGFFVRFVSYMVEGGVIAAPRNLHSRTFKFKVTAKKVKAYETVEVRRVLSSVTNRQRLYAMLGLNCGMTSADIGQLTKNMVNGDRLTRRRVKTGERDSVPTVTYRLWPETMELLKECGSSHPTLVLTGRTGEALWESRQEENGSTPQKDMISQQWKRAGIAIPHKAFRSIAATALENHPVYGRFVAYFLGHSPKSVKERNYAPPSADLFNEALSWLRVELLGQ